jgi:hypothetical protein
VSYKLDMFKQVLPAIDQRDFGFLERLSEDERKSFTPLVAMRFASAVSTKANCDLNLFLVNQMANINFFDIGDHPELQYKLLAATGMGYSQRHEWIPMAKTKRESSRLHDFLNEHWPDANSDELNILLKQFNRETFRDFVEGFALVPLETQKLIDAYDCYLGIEPETKKAKPKGKAKGRSR